jgi:hypothetical protein
MATLRTPPGLGSGGKRLWKDITDLHELDPMQTVQLTEACRAKDRLDLLDQILRGDVDTWAFIRVNDNSDEASLIIDDALAKANSTANLLKQLLAAMRLPDSQSGKRPQVRASRGAYSKPGKVSSLDRARVAKSS